MKRASIVAALALVAIAAPPASAAKTSKAKKSTTANAAKKQAPDATCQEPAALDADLVAGLASYAGGQWPEAMTSLSAWAAKPGAETDPGAARGFYSLSYAARATGNAPSAEAASRRAEPLLLARIDAAHTLEAAYYLQAIYQSRGDQASQLGLISATLKNVDAGITCARPVADDIFRIARLRGFAGDRDAQLAGLEKAAALYANDPTPSPYRAITEREIGLARMDTGDLPAAISHLALAAKLEPTMPGVHRAYGMALLKAKKLAEASEWWKANWRNERDNGNGLIYAIPVIDDVLRLGPRLAAQGIQDVTGYTTQALELNAELEAKNYLTLAAKRAEAGTLNAEDTLAIDVAELRMAQLMVEYVARGMDLQEFALQKGLLPAIHHRDLPKR